MQSTWKNKNVMVCGASAGLGWQLVLSLAERHARVIMVARDPNRLNAAQAQILQRVPAAELVSLSADLTDAASAGNLAEEVRQRFGQLDLVINAVGESDRGSIEKLSVERVLELVRTNVGSGLNAIQQFAPLLKPTRGVLVLVGSLSSHFAPRFMGGYAIAKHGLAALAQQARLELAGDGVHVLLVSPGPIKRDDAGQRYSGSAQASDLPQAALKSGGGAKIKGLDPLILASEILDAAASRKKRLVRPRKALLLLLANAVSSSLGDYLLRKFTT
ncbi:MAG: SDR family oxidoreductase [Pirellulaceae bacterium]|nr:SDR family oxidoreductase [Pirellulaceae bacterium]